MLRFYPAPQSHFRQQQYYFDDDQDDEYLEYQQAIREQRERRALEEAQARRRAQEERLRRLRAQQQLEQEEQEYRQWQLERRRAAYLEQQRQKQAAIAEYNRRQSERQQREEQQRQQQQFDLFAQLFGLPAPVSQTQTHALPRDAAPSTLPAPSVTTHQPSAPRMSYTEAVTIIQSLAKEKISVSKRLHALQSISSRLESAKASFQSPETLAFDTEKSTSSTPVLAFSAENKAFHAYEESLTRLLTELDTITAQGSKSVKEERKRLAVHIEEELNRLDTLKVEHWQKKQRQQSEIQLAGLENRPASTETPSEGDESAVESNAVNHQHTVSSQSQEEQSSDTHLDQHHAQSPAEADPSQSGESITSKTHDAPENSDSMVIDNVTSSVQTEPVAQADQSEIKPVPFSPASILESTPHDMVDISEDAANTSSSSPSATAVTDQAHSAIDGYRVDNEVGKSAEDENVERRDEVKVEVDDQDSGSDFEMIE